MIEDKFSTTKSTRLSSMTTKQPQNQNSLPTSNNKSGKVVNSIDENLYVVTENGEQCFMWRANQLTYIAQDRKEIPSILASKFGQVATKLDLSFNSLTSFKHINSFANLNELILDNNCLTDDQLDFRRNLRLKTLSLNKNKLLDLYQLISSIKTCFPNLEYLSLIGNPLCPGSYVDKGAEEFRKSHSSGLDHSIFENSTIEELVVCEQRLSAATSIEPPTTGADDPSHTAYSLNHQKYRYFIIYHLPNLRFLDSKPIDECERDEALRRCFWMSSSRQEEMAPLEHHEDELNAADGNWHRIPLDEANVEVREALAATTTTTASTINDQQQFQLTIMTSTPSSNNCNEQIQRQINQPKGVFSRLVYKYTGKNSEGNRFIRNQDL